jgi:hypothetical protein
VVGSSDGFFFFVDFFCLLLCFGYSTLGFASICFIVCVFFLFNGRFCIECLIFFLFFGRVGTGMAVFLILSFFFIGLISHICLYSSFLLHVFVGASFHPVFLFFFLDLRVSFYIV